jgi:hypothetical protein
VPSFNAISNNDLLLITEENVEILKYLSHYNPSGPYYFEDIHHSKTELKSSSQKFIFKKNPITKSKKFFLFLNISVSFFLFLNIWVYIKF